MSALHERVAAIPAELTQPELFALAASRGPLTDELPRTFATSFVRRWTITSEPLLTIDLLEYHMFDVRVWHVRGAELSDVERVLAELPRVDPAELPLALASDDAPTLMRGLRTAAILAEPWSPALEQACERALTDAHAAVRWTAFRVLAVGRWPAAPLVRRALESNGDRHPSNDLLEQLAEGLEGAEKQQKKKAAKKKTAKKKAAAKKKTAAKKKSAAKKSTKKPAAKKSTAKKSTAKKPAAKKSTAKKSTAKKPAAKKPAAKKSTAKKSTAKKPVAKKPAKKSTSKKPAAKKPAKAAKQRKK